MLNRRQLRIKVMQALYAYFQVGNTDLNKGEKELIGSIWKVYDLYIHLLVLLIELQFQEEKYQAEGKNKRLPTAEDLNPNTRFVDNSLIRLLQENTQLRRELNNRKVSWQVEDELVRKLLFQIRQGETYQNYLIQSDNSFEAQAQFLIALCKNELSNFELLDDYFEAKSIYWADDMRVAMSSLIKTLEGLKPQTMASDIILLPLFKEPEEDQQFATHLYRKTILQTDEFEALIADKTTNWEVERIAMMDILLMKMALTEILQFESIPVKVTLNEYIEISKLYSSPKSKVFINGILDKLVQEFKSANKIQKTGRGLAE